MSKFLETSQYLKELNTLWDKHAVHIGKANASLNTMLKTASKIPSSYISTMKKLADSQDNLVKSSSKLHEGTEKAYERQRLAEIKLQQAREKAFDNFEKQLKKQADAIDKQTAKELNSNETRLKSEQKLNQQRDEALKKHNALVKVSTDLEERKQVVLNKTYNSTKEIDKITAKQIELNSRIKESSEALMKLDTALHKVGSSSKIPGADVKINASRVDVKQAEAAAKAQAAAARETELQNIALRKQALIAAKLAEPYNKLKAAHNEATRTLRNLLASEVASNSEIRIAQKEFDILSRKIQKADNAVGRLSSHQQSLSKLSQGVGSLMSAFGISTGIFLAVDIVKNIYDTTKQLESMNLALKMVSDTGAKYAENIAFINTISERWGLEIMSTTEQFTKFYADAKGKLSEVEIQEVYEGIAKAGSIMGLSLEKQQSAFTAFQQMLSKGTIQAQELKLQLGDALPGSIKVATAAYQKLHPELKVTEALLYKHMEQGKLISSEMIPEMVKGYQKLYGIENTQGIETLMAAQNRLKNSWTDLVKSMNESETGGISKFFGFIATGLSNGLKLLTRYNTEWETLNGRAKSRGSQFAVDNYNTDGQSDAMLKANKDKIYAEAQRVSAKIVELNKQFKQEGFFSEINPFSNTGKDIEELNRELGQLEGAMKKINTQLRKDTVAKQVVDPNDDKAAKAAKAAEKAREAKAKTYAKIVEKETRDEYNAGLSILNNEKFILEQRLLLKDNNYSENIRIATEIGIKEQEIAKYVYDEEIRLSKGSNDKKIIADNKYYQEKIKLAKDFINKLNAVEYKPQYKDKGKVADEETYGSGVFETKPDTYKNMTDLWDAQQKKKDEIAAKEKERLLAMRDVLNDIFKEFGEATGFEKTMEMFSKVGRNGKTFWENLTGGKEGEIDLKEGLTAGLTITQDVGNAIFNKEQERIRDRMSLLDAQKEEAIKNAGDSASAKAAIEEEYEKKAKELRKREAIAKKKQAMFNIGLDTAQAIMGLWVKPGFPAAIPLAAAVGALGIAQMVVASSKSIPSYYVGTDNAQAGFANTDEFGAELHLDKEGNIKDFGSNSGPRIKYLESGDKIIPAAKTADILKANDFSSLDAILSLNNILYNNDKNIKLDTSGIISSIDSLKQTIVNKETSEEHYDVRGWTKYTRNNGVAVENKNNRIRFKKSIL